MDDRTRAADAPTCRARTPTIRDVARIAEVSIGTASKALNASGRLRQETRDKVLRRRPRDRLPAERPGAEPAPRQVAHHRHHHQRQFRPLHLPDRRGAGGAARRRGHRRLHVQRHRRSGARAPASRPAARQAHRRAGGDRAPRRQAPADRPVRARPAGRLRLQPGRRSRTRSASCPTTRAARCWRSSTSPASAARASPMSPGPSISRRCGCAANGYRAALAAAGLARDRRLLPVRRLVGGLGTRGRRPAVRRHGAAARRAVLRQRPDRPRRRRRAARARHRRARRRGDRRLRQLGGDGARRAAAADQHRHEPQGARARGGRPADRHDRRQAGRAASGAGPARWWCGIVRR